MWMPTTLPVTESTAMPYHSLSGALVPQFVDSVQLLPPMAS